MKLSSEKRSNGQSGQQAVARPSSSNLVYSVSATRPENTAENTASRLKQTRVSEQTLKATCFHVEDNLSLTLRCFFDAQTAKGMKTRSKPDRQA